MDKNSRILYNMFANNTIFRTRTDIHIFPILSSMKRFIISIVLFLMPLCVFLYLLEFGIRSIPNDYSYKNKWLEQNVWSLKVLSLGMSHGFMGIQPNCFDEPAFNAAHVSQSLKYDAFIFDKFIEQADSLQIVILPISYVSLWFGLEESEEWWRVKNYCIYYQCPYHRWENEYRSEVMGGKLFTLCKRLKNNIYNGSNEISCDSLGWATFYTKAFRGKDWWMNGESRARSHTFDLDQRKELFAENKLHVESIIKQCFQKQIKVVLLTTPTCSTYYDNIYKKQLDMMLNYCDSISSTNENVFYLDLLKDNRFNEEDFFDADHLNEFGAEKLSRILNDFCNSMVFQH